jgi:hypothetical protein
LKFRKIAYLILINLHKPCLKLGEGHDSIVNYVFGLGGVVREFGNLEKWSGKKWFDQFLGKVRGKS